MNIFSREEEVEYFRFVEDVNELLKQLLLLWGSNTTCRHSSNLSDDLFADSVDDLGTVNALLQEGLLHKQDANLYLDLTLQHLEVNEIDFANQESLPDLRDDFLDLTEFDLS